MNIFHVIGWMSFGAGLFIILDSFIAEFQLKKKIKKDKESRLVNERFNNLVFIEASRKTSKKMFSGTRK